MRVLKLLLLVCMLPLCTNAQFLTTPQYVSEGKYRPRHEFISYSSRLDAQTYDPAKSQHYVSLNDKWSVHKSTLTATQSNSEIVPPELPSTINLASYSAVLTIPSLWLDRDMFLHIESVGGAYELYVNNIKMGYSEDSRTPAQYNISEAMREGDNKVRIDLYDSSTSMWVENPKYLPQANYLGNVFVYSQPKLRVEDFTLSTIYHSNGKDGVFNIETILKNSYRAGERIMFTAEIYRPDGARIMTDVQEVELPAGGTDTVSFSITEWPSNLKLWSPETPNLYTLVLKIRRDRVDTEFIYFKFGFNSVVLEDGRLIINNKAASLNPAEYNSAPTRTATKKELDALKSKKINTICVSYPQPRWFYELCDEIGFYVVDQANINGTYRVNDRNVGGGTANNPDYLNAYLDRVSQMQGRSKNYTSVIAISMGGQSGNGYNLYKAFRYLKSVETKHPITYQDAGGEWNSEMDHPLNKAK